ncbi:GDSL esterase/lipase [Rhynchospora pubera]|uniref:GDSL esterase/lipase n=1 Tax=Rhynchospora pubera TaxID=906938 RepID=A0AAV8CEP5_9POAL|nr:GDSL esterase/lipase [Rhynchospora pubera]KAJ4753691.1 GDSL esterase/lipase [Rhynchospora pubera]
MNSFIYVTHFTPRMIAFVFVGLSFMSALCSGTEFPTVFVFGDSLLDPGNNDYIITLSRANHPPNGIDFPNQVPTGRFTNGRTIVDIIGNEVGFTGFLPPYLAPNTTGRVVLQGVNYASGASGILKETGALFGGRIELDEQIDYFANTKKYIISILGTQNAANLIGKAIFTVSMGSNDFLNNYLIPILSEPKRALIPPDVFVDKLISKYSFQLTRLYSMGAHKIVVVNVGPIGCIPYVKDILNLGRYGCLEIANQIVQRFNERLKDLVAELSTNLKGSLFVYADAYRIVNDIYTNYKRYGFDVPDAACCYLLGHHGGILPCGPGPVKVCADRSKYIFWDAYHPSEAANVIITRRLLDGDKNDIFPMNMRQLLRA